MNDSSSIPVGGGRNKEADYKTMPLALAAAE
jgi:hypothetical protein